MTGCTQEEVSWFTHVACIALILGTKVTCSSHPRNKMKESIRPPGTHDHIFCTDASRILNWKWDQQSLLRQYSLISSFYFDVFYLLVKGWYSWTTRVTRKGKLVCACRTSQEEVSLCMLHFLGRNNCLLSNSGASHKQENHTASFFLLFFLLLFFFLNSLLKCLLSDTTFSKKCGSTYTLLPTLSSVNSHLKWLKWLLYHKWSSC